MRGPSRRGVLEGAAVAAAGLLWPAVGRAQAWRAAQEEGPITMRGTVLDRQYGDAVAGRRIELRRLPWAHRSFPEPWEPEGGSELLAEVISGADGRFEFDGLLAGSYLVDAQGGQGFGFELPEGRKEVILELPLDLGLQVEIALVRPDGSRFQEGGARVWMSAVENEQGRFVSAPELRRRDRRGRELEGPTGRLRRLPSGTLWFRGWHPELGYAEGGPVELRASDTRPQVVLRFFGDGLPARPSGESNQYVGVGFRSTPEEGGARRVDEVFAGSPGERAGLLAGDRVVLLDGRACRFMHRSEFIVRTHGAIGTRLELGIEREGVPRTLIVERGPIRVPEE